MTDCTNNDLLYGYCIAYRTLLTLGKTGFGASRSYCFKSLLDVRNCRNNGLLYSYRTAYRTLLTLGKTGFGASRSYCLNLFLGVTGCGNGISYVLIIATYTSVRGISLIGARGGGYNCCIIVRTGRNSKIVSSNRTIGILKCWIILNLDLSAVLGEVKHSNHALRSLTVLCIHNLRIYKNLGYLIAVVSNLLGNDYVISFGVTADYHSNIRMLT